MRQIDHIIVHCSYTPPSMDIGAETIREWHTLPKPKGRGWSDIGYHWVIRRNGTVEAGRSEERAGAHAKGYNQDSIGICLIGGKSEKRKMGRYQSEFNFTVKQIMALEHLINQKMKQYKGASVKGHNDVSSKDCPCFNVKYFMGVNSD